MKKMIVTLGLVAASLTISGCEVKKTQGAKLPAVDVKSGLMGLARSQPYGTDRQSIR